MNERGMVVHVVDGRVLYMRKLSDDDYLITLPEPTTSSMNHMFLMSPLNRIDEQQKKTRSEH